MNKITLFLIILVCALLGGMGIYWYAYIKPIAITRYVPLAGNNLPPPASVSPFIPAPSYSPPSEPPDTRSWKERFRDKTIPDVPGIEWQTYTNKEYGFGINYPVGWRFIKETTRKHPHALDSFRLYLPDEQKNSDISIFSINIFPETLHEFAHTDSALDERLKKGMSPDTTINGIDLLIMSSDGSSDGIILRVIFEKDGHTYLLGQSFHANNDQNNNIIEHMVKTLRIIK